MDKKLKELTEKRNAAVEACTALVNKANDEDRDFTAEEKKSYDETRASIDTLKAQIDRLQDAVNLSTEMNTVKPAASRTYSPQRAGGPEPKKEFENLGEFVYTALKRPNDARLEFHQGINADNRMDTGSSGGFAVPKQFLPELQKEDAPAAVIRPRAKVIPAGDPPDSEITMPALDQSTTNQYGGVTVGWIGEGATKPETSAALREISLKPFEVAGFITVTDKLLRNWGAASSVLSTLLGDARVQAEELAFLTGDGNGKPLGILSATNGSLLTTNRTTANLVKYADLANMFSAFKRKPNAIWVYNPSVLPQLINLADAAGRIVWAFSARDGFPDTLFGLPAVPSENLPVLGTKGDVMLIDPSSYLIKDGSGPFIASSEHVNFTSNKTIVKVTWNVDGQPWLKSPLKGNDARSYSPFIALDVPGS